MRGKTKCLKCGVYFGGLKCTCGWIPIFRKKGRNFYVVKELTKGDEKVAQRHLKQIKEILAKSPPQNGLKKKSGGGTLNDKG